MVNRSRLLVALALAAIVVALPIALVAINNQIAMAQATRLDLTPDGGSATAGISFDITVTAYNADDLIDTSYSDTISFTSSDPAAILPDAFNFNPSDKGVQVFSVTLFTSGSQSLTVTDTGNGSLTDTDIWSVSAGSLDHIVISPDTATVIAGGVQSYTAEAFDQFNNSLGEVSSTFFSIQAGAGGGWINNVYTSQYAGTWIVTGDYLGRTDTASLTVNAGSLDHVVISPDAATITAGGTQSYTAAAFDQFNNSRGDVTSGTAFSIDAGAGGTWAANAYTSQYPGNWTVTGSYLGETDTASLTVNIGLLHHIVISPDPAAVAAGGTQAYSAEAFDQANNSLGSVTSSTTFSIDASAGGSWAANIYTSQSVGTWTVTGSHEGLTDTASLVVVASSAHHIVISPHTATVIAGGVQYYTAEAFDLFNNSLGNVTLSTAFSVQSGAGGYWIGNFYNSQYVGTWTVTGSYLGLTDTASITVNTGTSSRLALSAASEVATTGTPFNITVTALDAQGNVTTGHAGTVSFTSSDPGAILPGNYTFLPSDNGVHVFSATFTTPGSQSITVRDTLNATLTDTETWSVSASPTSLSITPTGGSTPAGTRFSITVTVRDPYGNIATTYTGTISFSSSDAAATLPAPTPFYTTDRGVHVFWITLPTPGNQWLTVRDTQNAALTDTETWSVEAPSIPPGQPGNISPDDGATGVSLSPTLQSAPFSDPDSGDTHAASQWQVTTTRWDYVSPVFDSGSTASDLTAISVPSGRLASNTLYYWRVRHQDNRGAWSDWSNQTSFTTAAAHLITAAGGQAQTADGRITAVFPSGAVNVPVMVTINQVPRSAIFGLPDGFKLADTFFSIEAMDDSASAIAALAQPVAITVYYSTGDVTAADGDPENLVLACRDEVAGEWKILATAVNTANMTLSVSTTQLSTWAVLVPSASAETGGTPFWIWIVAGLVIFVAAGIILMKSVSIRVERDEPRWQ